MKKLGLLIMAVAFVLGSGFLGKDKDGSVAVPGMDEISKQAGEATKQAEAMTQEAAEKAKKAAASINVKTEEIMADLDKTIDEMKAKVAGMDKARLVAYASKYTDVFADTQDQIAALKGKLKDLKWTEKLGAKGRELKKQISTYNEQFKGLKQQCGLYIDKLESYGVDLSAYGIDLSAYGL